MSTSNRAPQPDRRDASVVRPLALDDFEELFELVSAVAAEEKWIGAQPPLNRDVTFERWTKELDAPAVARFVAETEGQLVGEAKVQVHAGVADLGMQVAAAHRGLGLGAALLDAVIGWAEMNGAHKITLQVWPHNQRAVHLYERFGFVKEGRLRRHYRRNSGMRS
jgi:RimJ/RimL family protein N-acetyltransferase